MEETAAGGGEEEADLFKKHSFNEHDMIITVNPKTRFVKLKTFGFESKKKTKRKNKKTSLSMLFKTTTIRNTDF